MTVDLTTYGRRSGLPTRIEIWWFRVEGRFIITGTPGKRDWFANVLFNPGVVVHTPIGDFNGTAHVVADRDFRQRVFEFPEAHWYKSQTSLARLVDEAPMIEIQLDLA